jgi:hypothetical protein
MGRAEMPHHAAHTHCLDLKLKRGRGEQVADKARRNAKVHRPKANDAGVGHRSHRGLIHDCDFAEGRRGTEEHITCREAKMTPPLVHRIRVQEVAAREKARSALQASQADERNALSSEIFSQDSWSFLKI